MAAGGLLGRHFQVHLQRRCLVSCGELNDAFFHRVLERFPPGRALAVAYGSGVFKQDGHASVRNNVTDFIIAVDDAPQWHRLNLLRNPKDYSGLMRLLGGKAISDMQDKWAARLYFNTLVPYESGLIKYGVISRDALIADLLDWESLYAAGRFHKPIRILEVVTKTKDSELHLALRMNLRGALHTALLLLPDRFSEEKLYRTITSLSYHGDFRMAFGEDRNKVSNIVKGSLNQFRYVYQKQITLLKPYLEVNEDKTCVQDVSPRARYFHLSLLPKNMQNYLVREWNRDGRWRDVEDVLRAAAVDRDSDEIISKCLCYIVSKKAASQAVKGVVSAGLTKSVRYSYSKLVKMAKSYGI